MTHAQQLVAALRRRGYTTLELEALKVSTCPWKRLSESGHRWLKPGERIDKSKRDKQGRIVYRVVRNG